MLSELHNNMILITGHSLQILNVVKVVITHAIEIVCFLIKRVEHYLLRMERNIQTQQ